MLRRFLTFLSIGLILLALSSCTDNQQDKVDLSNAYPWVIVEFDSMNRTPAERIQMLNELGFTRYAYDWNIEDMDSMAHEFELAKESNIAIEAVWFWLNAKRDGVGGLHESNEKMLRIVEQAGLKTTLWVSFNNNFFEGQTQEESIEEASSIIRVIHDKATRMNCKVAIYNHRGWFGNPKNQVEVVEHLSDLDLGIVYNFHHAHHYLDELPGIVEMIKPYLISVNLNGMEHDGPEIMTLGEGSLEEGMIAEFRKAGYDGPWGILGHVREEDVRQVLERNIEGYEKLILEQ